MNHTAQQLINFIKKSPDCFHAVRTMEDELASCGFHRLHENRKWTLERGGKYYVTRNGSSLIAFSILSMR